MKDTSTPQTRKALRRALVAFAACVVVVILLVTFVRVGQPLASLRFDARTSTPAAGAPNPASAALSSSRDFLLSLDTPTEDDLRLGYQQVNAGIAAFDAQDITTEAYKKLSPLDALGRCGVAMACLGPETLSTDPRSDISWIHPSGWHQHPYDFIDGGYLYNRSHLIAHSLSGLDDDLTNLISGTRAMNADSMEPIESMVRDYIRRSHNHVLYRVTPVFVGDELLCRGVQVEAMSMEDGGQAIQVNVFIYNAQAGVEIDYESGKNRQASLTPAGSDDYNERAQRDAVAAALSR